MKKIFFLLVPAIALLSGCNESDTRLKIVSSMIQVDSQLPDVPPVPEATLKKVVFDFPRDMAQKLVKNTPACTAVADKTTPDFIMNCTYYPILRRSNVFIGLDRANFQNLNNNINELIRRNNLYKQRISEVNRQRSIARGEQMPVVGPTAPTIVVPQSEPLTQ